MSEEEIFNILEKGCILDNNCYEVDCLLEEDLIAIRGLVKLYNKEKEKNKKLQEIIIMNEKLYNKETKRLGNIISELLEE